MIDAMNIIFSILKYFNKKKNINLFIIIQDYSNIYYQ